MMIGISIFVVVFVVVLGYYFIFGWKRLRGGDIPRWVIKAERRFYNKQTIRPYDKTLFFKGNNYMYKVHYRTITQGQIDTQIFKRKRFLKH